MNKEQLQKLRKEIVLNSMYYNDYENSFNIGTHDLCAFFDSYVEYLQELMNKDNFTDNDFFQQLKNYDKIENLDDFYNYECSEYFNNVIKQN